MNTRTGAWGLGLLAASALACGGSHRPTTSECGLVGRYGVTDTLVSADGLCDWALSGMNVEQFEVAEDSRGAFKWQLLPELRAPLWEHGAIDGSCEAHLEWSWTTAVVGSEGQEADVTFHEVRDFHVDATGVSGTRTVTATPSVGFPGFPCTWTGTTAGLSPLRPSSTEAP
jgi:hypothetical protein